MNADFLYTTLVNTGVKVCRLGLSASYRPGQKTVYKALDEGLNFFFCYGIDTQMIKVLREALKGRRENYVIATGAYNLLFGHPNLRRTLEKKASPIEYRLPRFVSLSRGDETGAFRRARSR
jgi:aryl-alcohol dehydrogenase-like predicted oxidoreductase